MHTKLQNWELRDKNIYNCVTNIFQCSKNITILMKLDNVVLKVVCLLSTQALIFGVCVWHITLRNIHQTPRWYDKLSPLDNKDGGKGSHFLCCHLSHYFFEVGPYSKLYNPMTTSSGEKVRRVERRMRKRKHH